MPRHGKQGGQLRRSVDPGPEGPRARQAAAGHVHPHRKPAAHHAGGHRQRRRRGARRATARRSTSIVARRRLGQRRGRRPRHSVRPASGRRRQRRRDRLHAPACRRQVRQGRRRRLQLLGRPARRRRQRHQCAVQAPRGDGLARRPGRARSPSPAATSSTPLRAAQGGGRRAQERHLGARLARRRSYFDSAELPRPELHAPAAQQGRADARRHGLAERSRRPARRGRAPAMAVQGRPARLPDAGARRPTR